MLQKAAWKQTLLLLQARSNKVPVAIVVLLGMKTSWEVSAALKMLQTQTTVASTPGSLTITMESYLWNCPASRPTPIKVFTFNTSSIYYNIITVANLLLLIKQFQAKHRGHPKLWGSTNQINSRTLRLLIKIVPMFKYWALNYQFLCCCKSAGRDSHWCFTHWWAVILVLPIKTLPRRWNNEIIIFGPMW